MHALLPVNVTALQVDLLVDGVPQLRPQRVEFLSHGGEQAGVHCVGHLRRNPTQIITRLSTDLTWKIYALLHREVRGSTDPVDARLSAELVGPRRTEVVVRPERLVERGDEVEESLPATLVTQRVFPIFTALSQSEEKRTHRDMFKTCPHYALTMF